MRKSPLPVWGFLFDPVTSSGCAALIFLSERSDYEPYASYYSGKADRAVLEALHEALPSPHDSYPPSIFTPRLTTIPGDALLELLQKNVQFYREPGVTLQLERVPVRKVFLISRYVRAFRYKQIGSLIDQYNQSGIELFAPACVTLQSNQSTFVTPPVVEATGSDFVALEGNTRFLYCMNNSLEAVRAVVVRGVSAELPGKPVPLVFE